MSLKRYNIPRSNIFISCNSDCSAKHSFPYMNGEESYRRIKLARNIYSNSFPGRDNRSGFFLRGSAPLPRRPPLLRNTPPPINHCNENLRIPRPLYLLRFHPLKVALQVSLFPASFPSFPSSFPSSATSLFLPGNFVHSSSS